MKKIHGKISVVLLMLLSLIIFAVCSSIVFGVSARSGAIASANNGQHVALAATASSDADEIQLFAEDVADEDEPDAVDPDTAESASSTDQGGSIKWLIWFLAAVIVLILLIVETFFFIQLSRKPKKVEEKQEQNPDVIIIETVQATDKVSDKD